MRIWLSDVAQRGKRRAEGTLSDHERVGEGRVWPAIVTTIMTTIVMSLRSRGLGVSRY